jgi:hypothetical protein
MRLEGKSMTIQKLNDDIAWLRTEIRQREAAAARISNHPSRELYSSWLVRLLYIQDGVDELVKARGERSE